MSRVTHLSLSWSLVIIFVLVLYQDTGQGDTITSCGFEDGNLCGYDQFNWMRRSGDTADTGPSSAYEGSYYLYIEANRNNVGDKAVLQTPGVSWSDQLCVSLAYHMYGEDIGTLTLSLSGPMRRIMYKTGNKGNTWIRYQERIYLSSGRNISFVIEGFKGSGDKGGIAIDDFSVVTGKCQPLVSLPYSCSFESDICDMWQPGYYDHRWLRTHKDYAAPETGSPGESGGSWFLSLATDPRFNGRPSIETPDLNFTGNICVQFKYYLSSNFSTVSVYPAGVKVYTDSAATGPKWRSVSLTVKSFRINRSITFYGQFFGGGQAASIALDELYISTNSCDDCAVNNGGCNQKCSRTDTGRTCSCRSGFLQFGETGCQDIDECSAGTDACSHECQNEDGRYICHCPGGWSLTGDGYNCQDIDECATATYNECDHVCTNVEGSYNCSCRATYILATDGRHCIECEAAYERRVAASQLLTSDCPTTSSHTEITLDDCLLEACSAQTGVVAYFNTVCNLKLCDGINLRLNTVSGSSGWDIYVLNTTWSESTVNGNLDAIRGGDGFPLVAVVAGVVVPVILLVVIVIAVVFIMRRRGSTREGDQSVQYVHDVGQPDSVGEVGTPPVYENQAEVGIYEEVTETPERQAAVTNTEATYKNAAFHGEGHYQDMGPGESQAPKHYDVIQ